jgi:flagellar motor switch protein FliG
LAHVLNQIGRTNERQILAALAEQDSQLADEVRRYMFVFDDIAVLDDRAMQRVIRELDAKDMALALRPATEELRLKFFQNMSQRAAEMLREEMSMGGQVRLKAVEEAQQRIIDTIKKLEDSDEIAISRGGSEDVLV